MKTQRLVWMTGIALALAGTVPALADPTVVSIALSSQAPNPVKAGSAAAYSVVVRKSGPKGLTVNLSASGLPAGVCASFCPSTITFKTGSQNSVKCILTLSTPHLMPPDAYSFRVTGAYWNNFNKKATVKGALTVEAVPAPAITSLNCLPDHSARLTCHGEPSQLFFIQATPEVGSPVWTTISTNCTDTAGWCTFVEPDGANYPNRFYRTFTLP